MYSPLLLRIAHLALTNGVLRILITHSLFSEPAQADFLDLGSFFTASGNSPDQESWPTDSSTDVDLFSSSDYPDLTPDDTDMFLAGNAPCHSDADLSQFDPYSKLRIRQACDVKKSNPAPALALPTLDELPTNSDENSIGVEEVTTDFNIIGLQKSIADENGHDRTCPEDKTFFSKVPVCDSGKMTDTETLLGTPYSTLYNVKPFDFIRCHYPSTQWCCLTVTKETRSNYGGDILVGYICYTTLSWDFSI